jgi:hypothetical protein
MQCEELSELEKEYKLHQQTRKQNKTNNTENFKKKKIDVSMLRGRDSESFSLAQFLKYICLLVSSSFGRSSFSATYEK